MVVLVRMIIQTFPVSLVVPQRVHLMPHYIVAPYIYFEVVSC